VDPVTDNVICVRTFATPYHACARVACTVMRIRTFPALVYVFHGIIVIFASFLMRVFSLVDTNQELYFEITERPDVVNDVAVWAGGGGERYVSMRSYCFPVCIYSD